MHEYYHIYISFCTKIRLHVYHLSWPATNPAPPSPPFLKLRWKPKKGYVRHVCPWTYIILGYSPLLVWNALWDIKGYEHIWMMNLSLLSILTNLIMTKTSQKFTKFDPVHIHGGALGRKIINPSGDIRRIINRMSEWLSERVKTFSPINWSIPPYLIGRRENQQNA